VVAHDVVELRVVLEAEDHHEGSCKLVLVARRVLEDQVERKQRREQVVFELVRPGTNACREVRFG
jgi:hypothetical protein